MLAAVWMEMLKLRRSRTVRVVNAVAVLFPVLTMVVLLTVRHAPGIEEADPATVAAFTDPDWLTFIQLNTQLLTAGMGLLLFALMASFLFAREYHEGTYSNLLMMPVARWRVVLAKFAVLFIWMTAVALMVLVLILVFGLMAGIGAPGPDALVIGIRYILGTTWLFFLTLPVISLLACVGRGYLAPMSFATGAFIASVPLVTSELSSWLPWSVPVSYAGAGGVLDVTGGAVAVATFLIGVVGTLLHYRYADATQ